MKEYAKKPIQLMANMTMDLGDYPDPAKDELIKPLYKG